MCFPGAQASGSQKNAGDPRVKPEGNKNRKK
jgi:hypothetical protein